MIFMDLPPVSPHMLDKVDEALGFKLKEWQRAYILDKYYDTSKANERKSGKTTAYIIKRLLQPYVISRSELEHFSDAVGSVRYNAWFKKYALEINEKLTNAGIKTCLVD